MKTGTCLKLILLGLLVAGVGVGIKLVARYTGAEYLTALARRELENALQADVTLGTVEHLGGGVVAVRGLALAAPGAAEPAIEVPEALVEIDLAQAATGRFVPRRATILKPVVRLSFSREDRRWNIEGLFRKPSEAPAPPPGGRRRRAPGFLRDGIELQDATLVVRHSGLFGDDGPRELTGVSAHLLPSASPGGTWKFDARILGGPLVGSSLSGWVEPGPQPEVGLDIDCRDLQAGEALWHLTPFWYHAPRGMEIAGRLDCSGSVRLGRGNRPLVRLDVDVSDGDILTPYYPLRVSDANGRVTVTESMLSIRNVQGRVPRDELGDDLTGGLAPLVTVSGSVSLVHGGTHISVEAPDLPICRRTIEGIPHAGPDVWRRLRPNGMGRLALSLTEPPKGGGHARFTARVDVRNVTAHPQEIPAPLGDLTGTIIVSNDGVRLANLCGVIAQAEDGSPGKAASPAFRADGFIGFDEHMENLRVSAVNLRTNEELVRAIPKVGNDIWRLFKPHVWADVDVLLRGRPGSREESSTVLVRMHGGRAEPEFLGMPLTETAGTLRVDRGKIFVEDFSGVLHTEGEGSPDIRARSVFRVRGTLDPAAKTADVDLAAGDLMLNERVFQAIPRVGRRLWEEAQPVGVAALSGKVIYRGDKEPIRFFLDMNLRDVALLAKSLPVPVDAMSGQLLVTENRVVSNRLSGVSCGGHFDGAVSVYYGPDAPLPTFALSTTFGQVDLGRFVQKFTRKETDLQGRISGAIDLGGEVGDQSTVTGKGHVELQEGYLWSRPLFVAILSVLHLTIPKGTEVPAEGTATFGVAGNTVSVKAFDLTGGGLSLSGRGDVGLDGSLNLTMVAVGAPEESGGIPLVTPFVSWLMRVVERELVRLDVSGTLGEPVVEHSVLSTITWPLTNLRSVLVGPLLGSGEPAKSGD